MSYLKDLPSSIGHYVITETFIFICASIIIHRFGIDQAFISLKGRRTKPSKNCEERGGRGNLRGKSMEGGGGVRGETKPFQ